jgi:hypothetical protein
MEGSRMIQKTTVTVVCDLPHDDQAEAEGSETISFALDGTGYEIDVCAAHAQDLHAIFTGYIDHARRAGGAPARRRKARAPSGRTR